MSAHAIAKVAFDTFDKGGTGNIPSKDLALALHAAGKRLTKPQVATLTKSLRGAGQVSLSQFQSLCTQADGMTHSDKQLREAFVLFAKASEKMIGKPSTGGADDPLYVDMDLLKNVVQTMGDKLQAKELAEFLEAPAMAGPKQNGAITFDEFVKAVSSNQADVAKCASGK